MSKTSPGGWVVAGSSEGQGSKVKGQVEVKDQVEIRGQVEFRVHPQVRGQPDP